MQITNNAVDEKIDCGIDYQVNIQYLTDAPSKYTFHYEVSDVQGFRQKRI
jgi:hypothetical protein